MNQELMPLGHAKDTLIDLAIRFRPKLLTAILILAATKPYQVGEYIAVVGVEGEVETIALFNTALRHPDRSRIIVPNLTT